MKKRDIKLPVLVKCMDCNEEYRSGNRLPPSKLALEGVSHLSEKEREDIFMHLAVSLSSFCEYVDAKYDLESNKIQIEIEFDEKPKEKAVEA